MPSEERKEVVQELLVMARAIEDEGKRFNALRDLLRHLPSEEEKEVTQELLVIARAIEDEEKRFNALRDLLRHLSTEERKEVVQELLVMARAIEDAEKRFNALRDLLRHLPSEEKKEGAQELLVMACAIEDAERRLQALYNLHYHMSEPFESDYLREGLTSMMESQPYFYYDWFLSWAIHKLPHDLKPQAFFLAMRITDINKREKILDQLLSDLPIDLLSSSDFLKFFKEFKRLEELTTIRQNISQYLPTQETVQVVLHHIQTELEYPNSLWQAIVNLPAFQFDITLPSIETDDKEAMSTNKEISLHEAGQRVLDEWKVMAWESLCQIQDEPTRSSVLQDPVCYLPDDWKQGLLTTTHNIAPNNLRLALLYKLALLLPAQWQQEVLSELINTHIVNLGEDKAALLLRLVSDFQLPSILQSQLLTIANNLEDKVKRTAILRQLAYQLPDAEQAEIMRDVLRHAREIGDVTILAESIVWLIPYLPDGVKQEALLFVHNVGVETDESKWLLWGMLASYFPERLNDEERFYAFVLSGLKYLSSERPLINLVINLLSIENLDSQDEFYFAARAFLEGFSFPNQVESQAMNKSLELTYEIDEIVFLAFTGLITQFPEWTLTKLDALRNSLYRSFFQDEALSEDDKSNWDFINLLLSIPLMSHLPESAKQDWQKKFTTFLTKVDKDMMNFICLSLTYLPSNMQSKLAQTVLNLIQTQGDSSPQDYMFHMSLILPILPHSLKEVVLNDIWTIIQDVDTSVNDN